MFTHWGLRSADRHLTTATATRIVVINHALMQSTFLEGLLLLQTIEEVQASASLKEKVAEEVTAVSSVPAAAGGSGIKRIPWAWASGTARYRQKSSGSEDPSFSSCRTFLLRGIMEWGRNLLSYSGHERSPSSSEEETIEEGHRQVKSLTPFVVMSTSLLRVFLMSAGRPQRSPPKAVTRWRLAGLPLSS